MCSARCSSRCWPTTALPSSAPTTSSSFADDTSVVGLISNNDETHYREEVHSWLNGVALTTCPSMWRRQRRLWWTSGETLLTTPHWPSTPRLWRESAALNSWGAHHRGPHLDYQHQVYLQEGTTAPTLSPPAEKSKPPSTHPHHLSTGVPLRACWPAASLSGTETVVQQTARPSSGQWTPLQKSLVPLSPPSWTFSLHDAPAKQKVSWRTPPTPPTVSSSSYPQVDGTGVSEPAPPDCQQLFPPGCESPELTSHPAPLWNPQTNTPPPPPPPPPPNLTTSQEKTVKLLSLWNSGERACTSHL